MAELGVRCKALLAAMALAAPLAVHAQAYCDPRVDAACYQRWCRHQNGQPVYRGNWGCDMSGARSAPGYSGGTSGAELGRQIGGALGGLIREGLFGNPQQDAARQQAAAAQRQWEEHERRRLADERARQDEERYQRLRSSLLGFGSAQPLSLMGRTPTSGGLQLMLGEEAERSLSPALRELARAAAWSTMAARAATPEDSVLLADAAFQSLLGEKVGLPPPPPDVKGAPVHAAFPEVQALKQKYMAQRTEVPAALTPLMEAEERRDMFMRLESEARAFEVQAYQGVRKQPKKASREDRQKAEAELRRAKQAVEEARAGREKAEADVQRAHAQAVQRQEDVNALEQTLRAWLSSFAAGERKPDSYYYLGFEDGSQCFSQNAGLRCDKARAPKADFDNCLASYRLGYTAGEKMKQALLEDAYRYGESQRDPKQLYENADTRANGPCRAEYLMSYNNGRRGAPLSRVGR